MAREYDIECQETWINGTYRYRLDVRTRIANRKRLVVIQINPSKAGRRQSRGRIRSDSTIGKVAKWAKDNSYGQVTFLNLFALIATDQAVLSTMRFNKLVGSKNDKFIGDSIRRATTVVVAWGRPHKMLDARKFDRRVQSLRKIIGRRRVHAVGAPVQGHPRHGRLWNKGNRELRVFRWPQSRGQLN